MTSQSPRAGQTHQAWQSQPLRQSHRARRGIALLFVISLIVVFFLFATTFVAMSTSFMRSSDRQLRVERTTQVARASKVVDDVMYMLLRDVMAGHPLYGHSLLGDQYGVEPFALTDASGGFNGTCDFVVSDPGYSGQVLRVQLTASNQAGWTPQDVSALIRSGRDDFLGRFLTFADGPLANVTMPIVEYKFRLLGANPIQQPENVESHFFVLVQSSERSWAFTPDKIAQMAGARFVVNGRPFDGTPTQSNEPFDVVSDDTGTLRQNRNLFLARDARGSAAFPPQLQQVPSFHRYLGFGPGGVDVNGMTWRELRETARAALRPSPLDNPNFTGSNPGFRFFTPGTYGDPQRVPNYTFTSVNHYAENGFDSAAVEHWRHLMHGLLGNDPATLSDMRLPMNAVLDVDTDGDGHPDAIWIDIGLSPIMMPNGTRVKPLVAVKIEDLDGRLHLGAHGSLAELVRGGSLTPLRIPYGQGYGPAEIPLSSLLSPAGLELVLRNRYGTEFNGGPGVGVPDVPGLVNPLHAARWFGFLDPVLPSLTGGLYSSPSDYQGQLVFQPTGLSVNDGSYDPNVVGPPYAVLDANPGMSLPFAQKLPGAPLLRQVVNSPYQFNLFAEGSPYRYFDYSTNPPTPIQVPPAHPDVDIPFNVADLEALLRRFDSDFPQLLNAAANLRSDVPGANNRRALLQALLLQLSSNEMVRKQLTTHSVEVPALPSNIASVLRRHLLLRDMSGNTNEIEAVSAYQPRGAYVSQSGAQNVVWGVEEQVLAMLGQEVVAGLPFNLHRKFGNGRDDNGNAVIDDYGDPFIGGNLESNMVQTAVTIDMLVGAPIDLDFDNNARLPSTGGDPRQFLARTAFARQLYVLMLMMVEPDYSIPTNLLTPEAIRRRIAVAQWAINVVDFMDPDSISTPFEFDINPFNGWHVDGHLRTRPTLNMTGTIEPGIEHPVLQPDGSEINERYVVWGVERPDVLLTEAGAFHDHRSLPRPGQPDQATQAHMPNPSAFFELYNPNLVPFVDYQSMADTHASLNDFEKGVNLRKMTPAGEPVYRLLVVKDEDRGLNPDWLISAFDAIHRDHQVNGNLRRFAQGGINHIERSIYFVNPANLMVNIDQYRADQGIVDADLPTHPLRVQLAVGEVQHFPSSLPDNVPFVLQPGHHAVVGSAGPHFASPMTRNTTIFGRIPGAASDDTYDPAVDSLDRPAIRLNPGLPIEVGYFDPADRSKMRLVPNTLGIPLDRNDPLNPNLYGSFAISGPLAGYPDVDAAGDPVEPEADGFRYETPYQNPFYESMDQDISSYGNIFDFNDPNNPTYRHLVLQRLANPQQPFHPEYNPYLTLDDIAIGLNGYGGMGEDTNLSQNNLAMRGTLQRGRQGANTIYAFNPPAPGNPMVPNVLQKNVWLRTPTGQWDATEMAGTETGFFPLTLTNYDPVTGYATPENFSFGQVNFDYAAQMQQTVPWLRIANRPLISQFELASVPIQSNALLLEHIIWTRTDDPTPGPTANPYQNDALWQNNSVSPTPMLNDTLFSDPLARIPTYLFNFYGQTGFMHSPARIFEFTSVPSPFVGTETFLNPLARASGGFGADMQTMGGSLGNLPTNGPRYGAPFNFLSNRRNPGKLNLNTMHWAPIWTALMGGTGSAYEAGTPFGNLTSGFVGGTHGRANPLRHMAWLPFDPSDPADPARRLRLPPSPDYPGQSPYYDMRANLWMPTALPGGGDVPVPWLDFASNVPVYDSQRNEYFRLQKRQRMANMTTQRSSVFAMWITVGYFEMEEVAVPIPDNPDVPIGSVSFAGNLVEFRTAIGREYGLDRGQVRRDRAFYVVDRSIPVGFFPGENLNVDKTILTRRYLP